MKLCRLLFIMMTFFYVSASFGNISETNTKLSKVSELSWIEYTIIIVVGIIVASVAAVFILTYIANKKRERRDRMDSDKSHGQKNDKPRTKNEIKKIPELERKIEELEDEKRKLEEENASLIENVKKLNIELQEHYKKQKVVSVSVNSATVEPVSNLKNQEKKVDDISNIRYLTVLEGPLVEAGPEHVVYYKAWKKGGVIYFEFVNNDRTKKAINNRTSIIDPFCEKVESSKSPDDSEKVITITPGLLDNDYSVIEKARIEYK